MKMQTALQTYLTAITASLATLYFVSAFNINFGGNNLTENIPANLELINKLENPSEGVSADPYIGEVILFAGNFAPRGWAFCQGQLLSISNHQALFSLLGTTYGGDGRTTFGLPDLRGRVPIGPTNPQGGFPLIRSGDKLGTVNTPTVTFVAGPGRSGNLSTAVDNPTNYQPSLGMHYIIALQGTFPSRS